MATEEALSDQPAELSTEQLIIRKVEGVINARAPKDPAQQGTIDRRINDLVAESKEQAKIANDISGGGLVGMFFSRKPPLAQRQAVTRQAAIQAELATLRLQHSVGWRVLEVQVAAGRATVVSTEALAKFPLCDAETATTLGYQGASRCSWPTSTARAWMNSALLAALPDQIRSHMCQTHVQSRVLTQIVASDDWLFLPSSRELPLMKQRWGLLDGRPDSFWLRDVGLDVGQDGQRVLSGDTRTYNPTSYDYGIQVLASVSLQSFPSVVEILASPNQ